MTAPDRTWDPIRYQRGTRGFATFLTVINGLVVLGIGLVAVPAGTLGPAMEASLLFVTMFVGIAHLAAAIGLVRARSWAASLVAYLAGAGIGASAFAILLVTRAGVDIMGASGPTTIGFFLWMIGMWAVATRFATTALPGSIHGMRKSAVSAA